jgi:hypothetical protein
LINAAFGEYYLSEVGIGESINAPKKSVFAKLNFLIANYKLES